MNKGLVMDAIVAFKGVWPEGATHILNHINGDDFQASRSSGALMRYLGTSGVFNQDFWQIACTREEFEARVEALFDGAPEGVTHIESNCIGAKEDTLRKWKKVDGDVIYYLTGFSLDGRSIWSPSRARIEDLTPRPKQKPTAGKWLPEAGQGCEYKTQHQWIKVTIDHIGKKFIVFHGEHDREFSRRIAKAEFRPLKTEAEKEREKLYAKAIATIENNMLDHMGQPYDYRDAAEALIDAGWRPHKGMGETIMKSCYKHGCGDYWRQIAADVYEVIGIDGMRKKLTGVEND